MASNEESRILENHGIVTLEHEMMVNGHHMVNRKQKVKTSPIDGPKQTIMIHIRKIDDCSCITKETFTEGEAEPVRLVETDMNEDQLKEFEEHWISLWHPQVTDEFSMSV